MRLIYDLVAFDMSCDCYVALPHGEVSWSVVYDGGISMPRGLKLFPYSTQLSMKFILIINVGILTIISMINTTSERRKQETSSNVGFFRFVNS